MDGNKKVFLLVDDDKDDRELFVEAVESLSEQINCHVATDGEQALDLLAGLKDDLPNVIFLDINMPVMNGWHCLKSIKLEEKYKNIPIIMYSTSSHQRDVYIATELGATCFCVKPEKFSTLKQILEMVNRNLGENLLQELKQSGSGFFKFKKTE